MPLMDRIYCKSFNEMHYTEQLGLIEKVRTIRSSALNAAKVSSKRITKSAMKNIAKNKGGKRKMMKDPTKAATKALEKLTPEQIALITKAFQNN
jgi:ribosome recycling factor